MITENLKQEIERNILKKFPDKGEKIIENGVRFKIESNDRLVVSVIQSPLKPFELYEKVKPEGEPGISLNDLRRVGEIVRHRADEYDAGLEINQTDPMLFTGKTKTYLIVLDD